MATNEGTFIVAHGVVEPSGWSYLSALVSI